MASGGAGATPFWTTGNKGATTIADSNTVPTEETCDGNGRAALLQTKWLTMKLAAGNLFIGDFEVDGTHGVLTLGREFEAFPSALRMHVKYETSTINHSSSDRDDWDYMKGRNDTCHVYIALTTEKVVIRTRNFDVFDKKGPSVVAYGEYQSGGECDRKRAERVCSGRRGLGILSYRCGPKYLIIVCSSSKYGNLFTGGDGSRLWLDNFELIYE